jgi:hypothetical protein
MLKNFKNPSILPGFWPAFSYTMLYLSLIVLIPLSAVFLKSVSSSPEHFWKTISSPQVVASYRLSFGASLVAGLISVVVGFLVAWVLVRYEFPGKAVADAMVDLPFALPTAVAGIALTSLYTQNGWLGQYLVPLGIKVAFTPLGIVVALTFIGRRPGTRRSRIQLGSEPVEDIHPGDFPTRPACASHWFCAGFRAGVGRVRVGDFHLGQPADADRNHAGPDRREARAVRLCGRHRDRRRHAGYVVSAVAGNQCDSAQGP